MFKQRLFPLMGIAFLALSAAAWADDDIQVLDEPAPTPTVAPSGSMKPSASPATQILPVTKDRVVPTPTLDPDDEALLKEMEAEKAQPVVKKPVVTPTPPVEDELISDEEAATSTPTPQLHAPVKKVPELNGSKKPSASLTPLPGGAQAEGQDLSVPGRGTKSKTGPGPVPTEEENGEYIQEDRTLRENDLAKRLGKLDKPLMIFTLDGVYSKAFDTNPSNSDFDGGIGGDFRLEVQFYRWIALGLYYDLVDFTGPGSFSGEMGMFARVIPLKEGPLEFYAIGGLGLNSLVQANSRPYPGNFQGFAGLGLHTSFNDNWGLDGNVVYTYYTPEENPLNAVGVRAGVTYAVDLQAFLASLTAPPQVKVPKGESKEPE